MTAYSPGARAAWPALFGCLLLLGCANRPVDRPREGAQPGRGGASAAFGVDVPPTVAAPVGSPTVAPPIVITQVTPSPSPTVPGRNPILSGLLPAPNAIVQPGSVNIGARISGSTEIVAVTVTLDGAQVQPRITQQDPRTWLIAHTAPLDAGRHEVKLNARDSDGRAGGYTWQFDVQPQGRPSPAPRARP